MSFMNTQSVTHQTNMSCNNKAETFIIKTLTLKQFESVHLNNVNHGDVAEPAEQPVCDQNCTSASHVTPEAAGTRHSEERQLLLAASKNKMLTTNRLFLLLQ